MQELSSRETVTLPGFFVKSSTSDTINRIFARQPFNRPHRPLAALCLPEIANRVARRLFYIPTFLLAAAGEATSPSKPIG